MTSTERPTSERTIDPAQTALGYFLKVSYETPASVVAQGARLAKIIKETGEDPDQLRDALLTDTRRMEEIILIAERMHKENTRAGTPSMDRTKRVVDGVFNNASVLRYLSVPQLDHLSGSVYEYYSHQRPLIFPEEYMQEARDRMLEDKMVIVYGVSKNPSPAFTIYQS